ncbi:predicted protein [Naegleria gruberi]|uniref:Predicted protein n=1 Tax=Naegleria gruberi TaxID=5762 RepID=D2VKQ1_NAEGR|nr:uncharacterized protein NAEGRDRAFT_69472 [Naegleria gruberi]EFC42634.1 predicted protein [Naegleria gruberi]|eukprot:XP_002675378.1 predicted protein [Naegleria gruberi strain NEG-M]
MKTFIATVLWLSLISTFLSLVLIVTVVKGLKVEQETFRLQHFSKDYSVDSIIQPVYQTSMKYLHGSVLSLLFNSAACQWNGSYSLTLLNNDYFPTNRPYNDVITRLESDLIYLDLSKLTCVNNLEQKYAIITIKLKRRDIVNIDPYNLSVFSFVLKDRSLVYENVSFSNGGVNDLENEFSFSLKQVFESGRNYFGFQYWVDSDYHSQTGIQIRYPKDITLLNSHFISSMELKFSYNRAPIINPNLVNSIPVISVYNEFYQVEDKSIPKPFDYILSKSRTSLQNRGLKPLIEEKSMRFHYDERNGFRDSSNNVYFIDPFSLVCAFSFGGDDYLKIDEQSRVIETKHSNYLLECSSSEITEDYSWTILAKKSDKRQKVNCYYGKPCPLSTDSISSLTLFAENDFETLNIWPELSSNISGNLLLKNLENSEELTTYSPPNTYQKPLTLINCFQVDFSQLVISKKGQINFEFKKSTQPNEDPFSTRISILDKQTSSFFLYQKDSPTNSDLKWSINPLNENVTFGLWSYSQSEAKLGDLVFVNYPRNVNYQLTDSLSMNVYFSGVSISTPNSYHRPHFTINQFTPNISLLNYVILQSFQMNYGEGLNHLEFDEGRIFNFFPTTTLVDLNGNKAQVKLTDLSCVYVLKSENSQYSIIELSDLYPKFSNDDGSYQLDCSEDVRDDEFVFMLVGKQFERKFVSGVYGIPIEVDSAQIVLFETRWSPLDKFTISVDVNTVLRGEYIFMEKQIEDFKDYPLSNTNQKPLNILGIFELDYSKILPLSDFSNSILSQKTFDLMFNDQPFTGPWELIVSGTGNEKSMIFAIAAFQDISALFNHEYPLSYSRQLQFTVDQSELMYSFQLSSSLSTLYPTFQLDLNTTHSNQTIIDPITKIEYVKIHSFSIQQDILNYNVKSTRKFTFSSIGSSLDPLSVTCAFTFKGDENFYVSKSKSQHDNDFIQSILWIVARYVAPIPQPSALHSIHPQPSTSQPKPSPTPLNSFERENGIPLESGSTFSRTIDRGQSILTSIELNFGNRLTISFSSLSGQSMQLFVGTDFKPNSQLFTTIMDSNQVIFLTNVQSASQTIYMLIQGPLTDGQAQFTILPLITSIPPRESSNNPVIQNSNDTTLFTVAIIILTLIIVILLIFGLGMGIYMRKQFLVRKNSEERVELVPLHIKLNQDQVNNSYHNEL